MSPHPIPVFSESLGPCIQCGEFIWVTLGRQKMLRKSGQAFKCIWGHSQVYTPGPSEADRLRAKLQAQEQATAKAAAEAERERRWRLEGAQEREHLERRLSAQRGVTTRLKNRVANGVCPCCNRSFSNLHRHMQTKHAGFVAEEVQSEAGVTIQ